MKGTCEQIPFHFFLKFMMLPRAIGIPRIPLSGNVVTIPKGRVTSNVVKYFKKYKIKVYTHTVNYRGQWEKYRAMGVSGIYSDAL